MSAATCVECGAELPVVAGEPRPEACIVCQSSRLRELLEEETDFEQLGVDRIAASGWSFVDEPIPYKLADVALPPVSAPPINWRRPVGKDIRVALLEMGLKCEMLELEPGQPAMVVDLAAARARKGGRP